MDGNKDERIENIDEAMEEALKENSTWKCDSALIPKPVADTSIPILVMRGDDNG
jgi:hypothetical protein